jgi:signal transduction histidine kinase/integral membrane sensor domain MASE1
MHSFLIYIKQLMILAAAYYVSGRLGLFLAIPPGQATAIWPASGIALAGMFIYGKKLWPAVFIGAVGTSLYHPEVIDLKALLVAFSIAGGASLQAVIGSVLVARNVSLPSKLEESSDILKIIIWGALIACLVNALVGTLTIYSAGFLSIESLINHFFTWWLGDVLGVIVFTPILLLLFSNFSDEEKVTSARKLTVSLVVSLAFVCVVLLFFGAKNQYTERLKAEFIDHSFDVYNKFEAELGVQINSLLAIEGFINASEYVSAEEFQIYTSRFFDAMPGIAGMSWLPKIYNKDRNSFEASIKEQGYESFEIRRRFAKNRLDRSEDKKYYFPIAYTEPYENNKMAHGLDVYGEDAVGENIRIKPLDTARDTGSAHATERFPIVQNEDQYGFIIYHPVYEGLEPTDDVELKRKKHIGYVNGIFLLPKLMKNITNLALENGLSVVVEDLSAEKEKRILYDSRSEDYKERSPDHYDFKNSVYTKHKFEVSGRYWQIITLANEGLFNKGFGWELWFVISGGALFSGLLSLFMLVNTARTDVITKTVDIKTRELLELNNELEEFAYRTSHDLRSPLISSLGLIDIAKNSIENKDTKTATTSLDHVKALIEKLNVLIQDILVLTEAKNLEEETQEVSIKELVIDSLESFSHLDNFDRLEIRQNLEFEGNINTKKMRLNMIVENLISNAIKYQDLDKEDSFIEINTSKKNNHLIFEVIDNGIGIPKELQEKVFTMFQRFHPKISYGSGLGLYMVRKSAELLNGKISFSEEKGVTVFTLKIPLTG